MRDWCRENKAALAILLLGLAFLAVGLSQGGYRDTLRKAVMVCLECIGIG